MKMQKELVLTRGIEIFKNMMAELLNYLLFFSIAYLFLVDFIGTGVDMPAFGVMAIVPVFYYASREIGRKIIPFFLLHFIPPIGILFLYHGGIGQKIVMFLISVIMMAVSISRRLSEYHWGMAAASPPAVVGLYLALYILDVYCAGECGIILLRSMLLFMVGYFIYFFLKQFLKYLDVNNRTTDHIPVAHVFFSAAGLVIGCTSVGGAIILLTTNRPLMEKLGKILQKIIIEVIRLVFLFWQMLISEPQGQQNMVRGKMDITALNTQKSIPSWLLVFLDAVFTLLAVACILFLVFSITYGIIKLIKAAFGRHQLKVSGYDDGHRDKVEALRHKQPKRGEAKATPAWKQLRDSFTYAERIRKVFRRTLEGSVSLQRQEKESMLLSSGTARECMSAFFPDRPAEATALVQLYEKARYGAQKCTRQDFRLAKELADKLK